MQLPDFLNFEPFNQLRDTMGAQELGDFVFFDPHHHLTGLERLSLVNEGLPVEPSDLRVLSDFSLAYKDARVLLYRVAAESGAETVSDTGKAEGEASRLSLPRYHLAQCGVFNHLIASPATGSWRVRGNTLKSAEQGQQVCTECLQRLRYQHFDSARHRHREYSERVQQAFDINEYFSQYPSFPIAEQSASPVF